MLQPRGFYTDTNICNSFSIVNETPIVMKDILHVTHVSNIILKVIRYYWNHSYPSSISLGLIIL